MELVTINKNDIVIHFLKVFHILILCKAISYSIQQNRNPEEVFSKFKYKAHEILKKYNNSKNLKFSIFIFNLMRHEVEEMCNNLSYLGSNIVNEIKFITVAFIDEFFITLDWDFNDDWKNKLLEYEFFSTKISGEKIFIMIDEFISHKSVFSDQQIGILLYLILNLGFQGKFLGVNDSVIILNKIKHHLFEKIFLENENSTKEILSINVDPIYINPVFDHDYNEMYNKILVIISSLFVLLTILAWYILSKDILYYSKKILSLYV